MDQNNYFLALNISPARRIIPRGLTRPTWCGCTGPESRGGCCGQSLSFWELAWRLSALLTGCYEAIDFDGQSGGIRVVCTTGQIGDMLANIGGEDVKVRTFDGGGR